MTTLPPLDQDELIRRISRDVADGYDEELEMEIEDRHPLPGVPPGPEGAAEKNYRQDYFHQLFRLQAELVKLQDWVVASGEKVLILFEGRDAAGKGGMIKRITQRLNPRVARVVALPAAQLHRSSAQAISLPGDAENAHRIAAARASRALLPAGGTPGNAGPRGVLK
jgi:hypothetical protein